MIDNTQFIQAGVSIFIPGVHIVQVMTTHCQTVLSTVSQWNLVNVSVWT